MSTVLPLLDNVIENLKMLTETIVVKYTNEANEDETLEKTKAFDYYYLASNKMDTFETYPRYTEEALITSGVLDPEMLRKFMDDRNLIPASIRKMVLEAQRFIVVRDYEEMNNYYRTYIGLPSTEDTELFFVDEGTNVLTGVPMDIPIHKLSDTDISKLQGVGFISKLVKERQDKKYLRYLGKNRLDLYLLRTSKNLAIIQINKQMVPDVLFRDFMLAYEQCREYFMVAVYIKEYASMHTYYDNIMGFMVMVSAIRKVMTNTFKNGIDRDFYDLTSIIKMFEAYQIPFIPEYTLEQHRVVLRNINNLIRIKATDRVLVDLVSLLGFTDVNIYKYYLVKSQKKDIHGNPLFKYKDIPGFGEVLDYEKMYNVSFSRVTLGEKNIGLAITNGKNKVDYSKVTDADPFWWEDEDLKNAIYQNEFNYLETKYLSFEIIYKMSKVIFESVYFLSMLHDRKADTSKIELYFNKIDYVKPISLFDICIFLFAMTAKKQGLKGEIIHDPTKIGHVLGFNFKADLGPIIDQIEADPDLNDPVLISYISDMSLASIDDIDNLYRKIKGFRDYIENKMFYCTDKELYYKYQIIYKTLMTTEYMGELFRLPDGDIAETYKEYLMYTNYELYEFLENLEVSSIGEITLHILTKMQEYCDNLHYIHQTAEGVNVNAMALMTLVNFFKSYTVDVEQFNIIYLIDSRIDNLIKFIDRGDYHVTNSIHDEELLYDTTNYTINIYGDSKTKFMCRSQSHVYMRLDDRYAIVNMMDDKISQIDVAMLIDSKLQSVCKLSQINVAIQHSEPLNITDLYNQITTVLHKEGLNTDDSFTIHSQLTHKDILNLAERQDFCITIFDKSQLNTADAHVDVITIKHIENLNLLERVKRLISLELRTDAIDTFVTIPQVNIDIQHIESLKPDEVFKYVTSHYGKSDVKFGDKVSIHYDTNAYDELHMKDVPHLVVNVRGHKSELHVSDGYKNTTIITPLDSIQFAHALCCDLVTHVNDESFMMYDTHGITTNRKEMSELRMRDDLKIVYN